MEGEVLQQDGVPPSNKQAFIYKKNATSTAKAITRKMRQSKLPSRTLDLMNNSAGGDSGAYRRESASKPTIDQTRSTSQNEADDGVGTQHMGSNEHAVHDSLANFNQLDSEVIATSEGLQSRPTENKRFHTGYKSKNHSQANNKQFSSAYYEDNIDSETEVFIDPQFESKLEKMSRQTADDAHLEDATRHLLSSNSSQPKHENFQAPYMTSPSPHFQDNQHAKAIDAVINSNTDSQTKQRMIAEIQQSYRRSQGEINGSGRRFEPDALDGSKLQKRKKRNANKRLNSTMQESIDHKLQKLAEIFPAKTAKKGNKSNKASKKSGLSRPSGPETLQQNHDRLLMPEVNEFIGDVMGQRQPQSKEEIGESRLAQLGLHYDGDSDRYDADVSHAASKLAQITPGRIRASKMAQQSQRNNFVKSPNATGNTLDFLNTTPLNQQKERASTKPRNPKVDIVDNDRGSNQEDAGDYSNILPAVKVQKKKKKLSPGSNSNRGADSALGSNHFQRGHPSTSRMSTSGMRRIEPKLRPTLDQSLHYIQTSIKVPVKQTHFYDDKHQSAITDQQMKNWNVVNNTVILDEFHTGKKKVPVNRHRIPSVGDDHNNAQSSVERKKAQNSPKSDYVWDYDGRRHKKSKKLPGQVITSNASLHKVDLPRINPNTINVLSPSGTLSQPTGVGNYISSQPSGAGPTPGKFLDPNDRRIFSKQAVPPAPHLNTESNAGPLHILDIEIKQTQDPNPITLPHVATNPNLDKEFLDLPDYDCPVCLERVRGRDTALHSRKCRTARCRFCEHEYPLADLDKHEVQCNDPIRCRFCNLEFPKLDIDVHEANCNELVRCRICRSELPMRELYSHESACNKQAKCRGCKIEFPQATIDRHEQECTYPSFCRLCRMQYPLAQLDDHEAQCSELAQCPACKEQFPRDVFIYHSEQCTRRIQCKFCSSEFLPRELIEHENSCNLPNLCTICNQEYPRKTLPKHQKFCKGGSGVIDPDQLAYLEMVERKRNRLQKKSTGKVLVEDDFLNQNRSRKPQSRKKQSKGFTKNEDSNQARSNRSKSIKQLSEQASGVRPPQTAPQNLLLQQQSSAFSHEKIQSSADRRSINERKNQNSQTNGILDALSNGLSNMAPDAASRSNTHRQVKSPSNSVSIRQQNGMVYKVKSDNTNPRSINKEEGNETQRSNASQKKGTFSSPRMSRGILKDSRRKSNSLESKRQHSSSNDNKPNSPTTKFEDQDASALIDESQQLIIQQRLSQDQQLQQQQNIATISATNQVFIASNGSFQPLQKEHESLGKIRDNTLIEGGGALIQNGRYDEGSNNEKMSVIEKATDDISNVKLSKQINSSNDITGRSVKLQDRAKSKSSKHTSDVISRQDKAVKSQNTTSQVRFAYGTAESFENIDKRMLMEVNAKVNSSQRVDSQGNIGYEQFAAQTHSQVNQSMHTRVMQADEHEERVLEVQQQVSVPTQGTMTGAATNKIPKNPTDQSTNYDFPPQKVKSRKGTTQGSKRSKISPKSKKSSRANTLDAKSRGSGAGKAKLSNAKSIERSNESNSPSAQRVMQKLTHHRVKIDQQTQLLINGNEVLSHKGIKGNIQQVGVGFGTGRHTSVRRLDQEKQELSRQLNVQEQQQHFATQETATVSRIIPGQRILSEEPISLTQNNSLKMRAMSPLHRQQPVLMDAETQNVYPDVQSEGCDPIYRSVKSQKISAHVAQNEVCLSARSATKGPDCHSMAVSAKPMSEVSVREQGDQITEGRFEPDKVDTGIGTGQELIEKFLYKPKADTGMMTSPIIFGTKKPAMISALIQTEPMISDKFAQSQEPKITAQAHEPETNRVNPETGSQSSLLELPQMEKICELVAPTEFEPSESEDNYVDDWVESSLYRYAYTSHYEHMVKSHVITVESVNRSLISTKVQGMTAKQFYDYNLNPENLEILTEMECQYGQSALRHKTATYCNEEMLQDLYTKAKTTIEVMNQNMVRPDITDRILFSHYTDVTKKNVIKLLIRARLLYEARQEAVNILKLVMEVDALIEPKANLWRILQENSEKELDHAYDVYVRGVLKKLSTAMMNIAVFQREHRLFKDEFKFNGKEYRNHICDVAKIIGGFLKLKKQSNPALLETGLLQEEHNEHAAQTERYSQWVQASLEEVGKLDRPDKETIEQALQEAVQSSRKLKGSRIDQALEKLREEQKERSEQDSVRFSMTNKSRILEQMQLKSTKLEVLHEHEFQKTQISDQMIERKQQSATKRERILREQEARRLRQANGCVTPDENGQPSHGQQLNSRQLDDDEDGNEGQNSVNYEPMTMRDLQQTFGENKRYADSQAHLSGLLPQMQDSILSSTTHVQMTKKSPLIVTGKFEDYKRVQVGKYDFMGSTDRDFPGAGQAYQNSRMNAHNNLKMNYSHTGFNADHSPDFRQSRKTRQYGDLSEIPTNRNLHQNSTVTPSELTIMPPLRLGAEQRGIQLPSQAENLTEFTEQIKEDEIQMIDLEAERMLVNSKATDDGDRSQSQAD